MLSLRFREFLHLAGQRSTLPVGADEGERHVLGLAAVGDGRLDRYAHSDATLAAQAVAVLTFMVQLGDFHLYPVKHVFHWPGGEGTECALFQELAVPLGLAPTEGATLSAALLAGWPRQGHARQAQGQHKVHQRRELHGQY